MPKLIKLILTMALAIFAISCTYVKPVARTINDAARVGCEVAFGEEELPHGVSVEDFCKAQENLDPFIEQLLAAKAGVKAGMPPPASEEQE